MSDMKEFWGMMHVLDNADDVAVFVVSGRDGSILYCNHLVTVLTNAHTGSPVSQVWDMEDYQKANTRCNEGGTYRYVVEQSPFGKRRNVTVSKVVWSQGILAYSFLITAHVDDEEEEERDKIFKLLGQDFRHIFLIDMIKGDVTTLLKPPADGSEGHYRAVYYHPVHFEEWKKELISEHAHPEDAEELNRFLEPLEVRDRLARGDYAFQYRSRQGEEYRWMELRFRRPDELKGRIICTERDVQGEISLNHKERESEIILNSIGNIYRSIYLLDLVSGEYTTVKEDQLIFGIPKEGNADTLLTITSEFIPDEGQKRDLQASFSIGALAEAFSGDAENVAREYLSALNEEESWVSVTAFRPPYMQGMEDKCVITFMDVTESKRVEAERDEKSIIIDILSSQLRAIFFMNLKDGSFHSIKLPQKYRYLQKQFKSLEGVIGQYARAYVLEQYREAFKSHLSFEELKKRPEDNSRIEYIYRTVENEWIRMIIHPLSGNGKSDEVVLVFEDYTDVMEQREMSLLYNSVLLADYDYMFEYDIESDQIYTLLFDGERLVRENSLDCGMHTERFRELVPIHPDDLPMFLMVCSEENLQETFREGKTVSHMFFRRMTADGYRLFMYGFHFFEDMGKRRVLIMARDSERELL
ncbi:MAG: hypothetical protein K6E50_11725 [Lachnospiraceae bacterium]|nr:hypothetical protein [Lachnospiraceae bacterium]